MPNSLDGRTLVEALPLPVLVLDPDDVVLAANTSAISALMAESDTPVGKNFKDVVAEAPRAPLARAIGEAKRRGHPQVATVEGAPAIVHVHPIHGNGALSAVLLVALPSADTVHGLPATEMATVNAELQAANDELAERLEQVQRAQRLDDERNRFLAMLAHELRNPLAAITNALHLLYRRRVAFGDRLAEQALRIAQRQAISQARLVDDLLDVSRVVLGKITLQVEPTDVVAIVRQALGAVDYDVKARAHALRAELPEQPLHVVGDPVRLEQVVANLLSNAVKYTPPGGEIAVALSANAATVTLSVTDTGIGMEAALLERVFDLFTQGEASRARSGGGLGIGLTVVRELVQLHGGTIDARSRGRGHGSTFEVRLPRTAAIAPIKPAPVARRTAHARRILVVDDNRDARVLLRTILELNGHQVQDVGDAANAVRLAIEWTPEIALIDIGLPEVDGFEVARRIRKRLGGAVRLIAVTGYSDAEARRLAADAGFDEHLVKPVDPDRLTEVLAAS